jgi:hypothetical protein
MYVPDFAEVHLLDLNAKSDLVRDRCRIWELLNGGGFGP